MHTLDCCTITVDDLDFEAPYTLVLKAKSTAAENDACTAQSTNPPPAPGVAMDAHADKVVVSAVCVSFDTHFDAGGGCREMPVEFRTDPVSTEGLVMRGDDDMLLAAHVTLCNCHSDSS